MNIGVNAEYYPQPEREPKNFLKLSDEVMMIIEMARVQVSDASDLDAMRDAAGALNDVFHRDELLGKTTRLTTDFSIVLSQELRYKDAQLRPVQAPDIVTNGEHEGVFVGCDLVAFNGKTLELAYCLELPLTTEGMKFRTVYAPVDSSELAVEVNPFALLGGEDDEGDLRFPLAYLTRIDDEVARKNTSLMIDLMDETEEVTADFLKELALLSTEILARPIVVDDKEARGAIAQIFASFIDTGAYYGVEGVDFGVTLMGKQRKIDLDEVEVTGQIHEVAMVEDFTYRPDAETLDDALTTRKTLQPAFIMLDSHNVEHVIPIRYLKSFYLTEYSKSDATCEAARERFMEEYPDIFDTQKRHTQDTYIVEKYFQKDDGGV